MKPLDLTPYPSIGMDRIVAAHAQTFDDHGNGWRPVTEFKKPPENQPCLVRVLHLPADLPAPPALTLAAMYHANSKRFRFINKSPEWPGAYFPDHFRVTHWQPYPLPDLVEPRYRVITRCYVLPGHSALGNSEGLVMTYASTDHSMSFREAQLKLSACRAISEKWAARDLESNKKTVYEHFIVRDGEHKRGICQ